MSFQATRREPAINLPGLLMGIIAGLVAIHAIRDWMPDAADVRLLLGAGFIPARWSIAAGWAETEQVVRMAGESADPAVAAARTALARYLLEEGSPQPWSFAAYALLHGSWMHVGLNAVWLAAFGTPVVRRLGNLRALAFVGLTALGGSLAYWLANPLSIQIVIGASAVVSGFMGAAVIFAFGQGGPGVPSISLEPRGFKALLGLFGNARALLFLAVWFAVNLLVGLLGAPLGLAEGGIAWEAHIGGLLAGLLAFPLLDPPERLAGFPRRT